MLRKKLELKTCNNAFYMFSLSELTTLRSTVKILNRKSSLVLTEFKNDGSFRICGLGRFYQSETDVRYENKHENQRNAKLKNYCYATLGVRTIRHLCRAENVIRILRPLKYSRSSDSHIFIGQRISLTGFGILVHKIVAVVHAHESCTTCGLAATFRSI